MRILIFLSACICLRSSLSSAYPQEPTRFTLSNLQNDAENDALLSQTLPSGLEQIQQLNISETQDNLTNPIIELDKLNQNLRSLTSVQSTTPTGSSPETVYLLNEKDQGLLERRKPDNIRQILNGLLKPTPIVDGIKDEQKYGNTGDKLRGINEAIINAYENFSNFLNFIIDLPMNATRKIFKKVTSALDEVGAQIIGLQK